MGFLVIIGVVFGLCYLQTLNEEAKKKKKIESAGCYSPIRAMQYSVGANPDRKSKAEYMLSHLYWVPPYCQNSDHNCYTCSLHKTQHIGYQEMVVDCNGHDPCYGPTHAGSCANCSYRRDHGGDDPFWDCTHPQAKMMMDSDRAPYGRNLNRPYFGGGMVCPYCDHVPDPSFIAKHTGRLKEWNDLFAWYVRHYGSHRFRKDGSIESSGVDALGNPLPWSDEPDTRTFKRPAATPAEHTRLDEIAERWKSPYR